MPNYEVAWPKVLAGALAAVLFAVFSIASYGGTGGLLTPAQANPNLMGINIAAPKDWAGDRLYADVISMSRPFSNVPNPDPNVAGPAPVDTDGWPMADLSFYVWAGIDQMNGTYTLSFKGLASVSGNPVGKVSLSYNPKTNMSKGTFRYTNASSSFLTLSFTSTKRTRSSAPGSGVTLIKLMRPLTPGSAQSYPPSKLFADPLKALISKFSVVRFMDFLASNSNVQTNWSNRPLPSWASFQRNPGGIYGWQGIGGPWEHVILLMNETGKDAWINIPARATDEYIRNVALMFAYGSDGVNPYTSPQINPLYPPLDANLKIYVEYSNELWNSAPPFQQSYDNCQAASDELVNSSGNSPLNWDKIWNNVTFNRGGANNKWNRSMCFRRIAKRGVEISNIFRSVFGDAAMTGRIRPVLMSQLGNPGGVLFDEMKMMLDYYNNMAGDFVLTPHPPSYYFYGAGGSGYYSAAESVSTLDGFFTDPNMTPAGFTPRLQEDAKLVAAMGLKRVAYEGGPCHEKTGGSRDAIAAQAVNDPRMTTTLVDMHNAWSRNGGELLVYYTATGDYRCSFSSDIYNLTTPKLQAIDALNSTQRAPPTFGKLVPGSIDGGAADTCSRAWSCNPIRFWNYFTADGSKIIWASYTFRSTESSPWTVDLSFSSASSNASVAVYVDGTLVGTQNSTGEALSFNAGTINPGLHGIIVRAVTGTFSLKSVAVALN